MNQYLLEKNLKDTYYLLSTDVNPLIRIKKTVSMLIYKILSDIKREMYGYNYIVYPDSMGFYEVYALRFISIIQDTIHYAYNKLIQRNPGVLCSEILNNEYLEVVDSDTIKSILEIWKNPDLHFSLNKLNGKSAIKNGTDYLIKITNLSLDNCYCDKIIKFDGKLQSIITTVLKI